jgi:hypothetical protein
VLDFRFVAVHHAEPAVDPQSAMVAMWRSLGADLDSADGDARVMNVALRERFAAFVLDANGGVRARISGPALWAAAQRAVNEPPFKLYAATEVQLDEQRDFELTFAAALA